MRGEVSPAVLDKLVRRAQSGDETSFEELFDLVFDRVYQFVRFRVDEHDAEDVSGDIFLKMVKHIPRYSPRPGISFFAWLFRIARNTVIDHHRKRRELLALTDDGTDEPIWDIPDEAPIPTEKIQKQWESNKIREILGKLSPTHREIIELKFLHELTNPEIAMITEKSEGNLRVIQLRALREMRKHFPDQSDL